MVTRRVIGSVAFAGALAGSAALAGYAKRRALSGIDPARGPEWAELHHPVRGRPVTVRSFDGTDLHAEALGPDDAPTLLLVHGYALSQHAWHYQRRDLSGDYRVVCYDQRGHGASAEAASGDYSAKALGRDFAEVLDAMVGKGHPVIAVGHSMGGMTILSFAEQFPERLGQLDGVVLMSTAAGNVLAGGAFSAGIASLSALRATSLGRRIPGWRRSSPGENVGQDPADWLEEPPADLAFLLTRALGLSSTADPAHVAFTEQLMLECPARVKAALGPTLSSLRLDHVPPWLSMPVRVMVGDSDRLTPAGSARRLAQAMPDAQFVSLADAGHMAPLEAHGQVSAELASFAARVLEG